MSGLNEHDRLSEQSRYAHDPSVWMAGEPAAPPSDVFQQIGAITRQLHDALERLGVMPKLQQAASGLPDARSRLTYIAEKCGDAADKVLNLVDAAKAEQQQVAEATRGIADLVGAEEPRLTELLGRLDAARFRTEDHLTEIMLAQDYHDLTGQVVARVVALALVLEGSLVQLLVQAAPSEAAQRADGPTGLHGPVVDAARRTDIAADQGEVDDLLASLGF